MNQVCSALGREGWGGFLFLPLIPWQEVMENLQLTFLRKAQLRNTMQHSYFVTKAAMIKH